MVFYLRSLKLNKTNPFNLIRRDDIYQGPIFKFRRDLSLVPKLPKVSVSRPSKPLEFRVILRRHLNFITQSKVEGTTIYAIATPIGKAGVAVIRISGPAAFEVIQRMTLSVTDKPFNAASSYRPMPGKLHLKKIVHPNTKELLDIGLVVWFEVTMKRSSVLYG